MASEDFFQDSTVTDVVQANIERVDRLEEKEQKRLLKIFKEVRRELQDRLLVIPEGTFTEQQLNVTLVQIQAAIQAIKQDLNQGMVDSSKILAERGVQDLIREVGAFSKKFEGSVQPLNIDAIRIAAKTESFLVNKYEASINAYGESLRAQITTEIAQGFVLRDSSQRTVSRLQSDIGRFFIGEEWKLNRIVRTELHNIYNFSKLQGMSESKERAVPDLKKTLIHPMDSRTGDDSKKLKELNPVVAIDEPFRFTYKGKTRVFQFPPDRPNDRSILVPYRDEWAKAAGNS